MNCKDTKTKLFLYFTDELEYAEKNKIDIHIRECRNCRILFKQYKKIFNSKKIFDYNKIDYNKQLVMINDKIDRNAYSIIDKLKKWKLRFAVALIVMLILFFSVFLFNKFTDENTIDSYDIAVSLDLYQNVELYQNLQFFEEIDI